MRTDHTPTPWAERHGGGVRCSCGWRADIGDRDKGGYSNMRACWDAFRRHWLAWR